MFEDLLLIFIWILGIGVFGGIIVNFYLIWLSFREKKKQDEEDK